jgi:hypothetical protein
MFGPTEPPLPIVNHFPMSSGYAVFAVEPPSDMPLPIPDIEPTTISIVVETTTRRGQGLACVCGPAEPTSSHD